MIKKKIGIDVDGVLADFSNGFSKLIQKYFGIYGNPEIRSDSDIIKAWYWTEWYPNFTKEKNDILWKAIKTTETRFWELLDKTNALRTSSINFNKMIQNNRVYFITDRPDYENGLSIQDITADWLKYNLGISHASVIVASNKGEVAAALELDYFLDDKYENCVNVSEKSPGTDVYMLERSYNTSLWKPFDDNFKIVKTLRQFPPFEAYQYTPYHVTVAE